MSSFQGSARVLSASPYVLVNARKKGEKLSSPAPDALSCIRTIHSLFPISESRRDEEPPAKRRKLGHDDAAPEKPPQDFSDKKSVVLVKISLDLVGTYTSFPWY